MIKLAFVNPEEVLNKEVIYVQIPPQIYKAVQLLSDELFFNKPFVALW